MGPDDVHAAVDVVTAMLTPVPDGPKWDRRAGQLRWSCRRTAAHLVDCLYWYASNLVRRSATEAASPDVPDSMPTRHLVDAMRSGGALLALAVASAPAGARAFHSYGMADASGFAAMGCDELLIHGYDLARGLGLDYAPPDAVADRTLRRLFPWAPADGDAWAALLWANGRQPLGDRPPEKKWLWHSAPLNEWDGQTRRIG